MLNLENCLLKVLKYFKKTNVNNKRHIKIFVNKILPLKSINENKKATKQIIHEFIYEGDPQTSDVKEIENETENDDGGEVDDNGDDDNGYDGGGEVHDNGDNGDDDGDDGDNDHNHFDGATVNEMFLT